MVFAPNQGAGRLAALFAAVRRAWLRGKPAGRGRSAQRHIEAAMVASEARFRLLFEESPIGLVLCELDGRIRQANAAFLELAGCSPARSLELDFWSLISGAGGEPQAQNELSRQMSRRRGPHEAELLRPGGDSVPVLVNGVVVESPGGEKHIWFTVESHAELKLAQQKLMRMSLYDDLTGLANRKLFRENLARSLAHAKRMHKQLALLYLDLDGFKSVNDRLGHDAGDTLLRLVANRLRSALRLGDVVGRLGGDEFAVLIEDANDTDGIARVAEKIIGTLAQPFSIHAGTVHIGTSIGIAVGGTDNDAELAKAADLAMYKAKALGGNRYHFYSEALHAEVQRRAAMEDELRSAFRLEQFELRYRPQIELNTGRIVMLEALLCWRHPQRGLRPADEFMTVLEQAGLAGAVGERALRAACMQLRKWLEHCGGPELRIAFNPGVSELSDPSFAERTLGVLDAAGVEPRSLELEIDERMLVEHDPRVLANLRELEAHGAGITIEGFGAGGSSLMHLKQLPLRCVKLDRRFIADVPGHSGDRALLEAVIAFGHRLGIRLAADGVESEWQRRFLAQAGCDLAQGDHVSVPLDAAAAAARLAAQQSAARHSSEAAC